MGKAGNIAGKATYAMFPYNLYDDTKDYKDGEISFPRYAYKPSTAGGAFAVGIHYSGLAGFIVGTAAMSGEMTYDLVSWWGKQIAIYNTQLENTLKSG